MIGPVVYIGLGTMDPVRGCIVIRARVNVVMEVGINALRKGSGHDGPRRWSEEDYFLG